MNSKYSYQRLFGTTLSGYVPAAVLAEKNAEKSWKYGYNEEYDFIVISKTGQIDEVYELQNVRMAIPKAPNLSEIRGFEKDIDDQCWERFDIPKELLDIEREASDWNARRENKQNPKTPTEIFYMKPKVFINKYENYISKDVDRRKFGTWQMVCGNKIWIPPSHYFFLQHVPVHGKTYPDFRFTNRDYYLFWEAVKADYRCLGMIYLKNRRSGASSMSGSEDINIGTSTHEGFLGIMSKTNRDAESYLTKMVIRPFKKLPWYFKPQTSGTTSARSGLNFREVAKKMSSSNTTMMAEEGLDTTIKQFPTSINSMDGEKVTKMTLDECFGKDFMVRMYDGSVMKVQDLCVGDMLMGVAGKPKKVMKLMRGVDQMYEVSSKFGKYTCNSKHKIRLNHSYHKESFLTPEEILKIPSMKMRYYQEEISASIFNNCKKLPIDPYLLGLWLGDGSSECAGIYNQDEEIVSYLKNRKDLKSFVMKNETLCKITISGMYKKLKENNLLNNKHIPEIYIKSSEKNRLKLLAGIIDTDGYIMHKNKSCLEVSMSRKHIIDDIASIASSLGLHTTVTYKKTHLVNGGIRKKFDAWRVSIYGDCWKIPLKVKRKRRKDISGVKGRRNPNKSKIKVTPIGIDNYYGFTVFGSDDLFLGANGVIHKNCGKLPTEVPFDQYWSIAEECLVEGFKVVGKCMAISTVNAQAKGGAGYKAVYRASDATERLSTGRTASGMYSLFIPAEWNQEGGYDKFGYSIVDDPIGEIYNRDGDRVTSGNLTKLTEKGAFLKESSDVLYNEFLRKHPRTEAHAFRDPAGASDMNLNRINEQMDYNELMKHNGYERGNFINIGNDEAPKIEWQPTKYGRFYVSWFPPPELRNNYIKRGELFLPGNDFAIFGVDPYKVSKTVDRKGGSLGAIHGLSDFSMNLKLFPDKEFFLEYIHRPDTIFTFLRDLRNCLLFYGCPALIENNVDIAIKDLRDKNMTHYSLRRKDKLKLTPDEKMYGGIPMTGDKVIQKHYFGIQDYVEKYVGEDVHGKQRDKGQIGNMPFNRTLDSWSKFSITNRTEEDASISSGLCILAFSMRGNKRGNRDIEKEAVEFSMTEYDYSKDY